MIEFKAEKRVSKKCREAIENCLSWHEKYKSSYFWTQSNSSASRQGQERKFGRENPEFTIISKLGLIEVKPELSISCQNFYYSLTITLAGVKKDVRILKKILK